MLPHKIIIRQGEVVKRAAEQEAGAYLPDSYALECAHVYIEGAGIGTYFLLSGAALEDVIETLTKIKYGVPIEGGKTHIEHISLKDLA